MTEICNKLKQERNALKVIGRFCKYTFNLRGHRKMLIALFIQGINLITKQARLERLT
jgi:hypothetical protein